MKKLFYPVLILLFTTSFISAQTKVYLAEISGTIDLGLAPYIRRVVQEAGNADAEAIIFKINTFGGRVDAATQIKDAILNSKVQTIAFIDKRAISAGSLISLSCEKIIMVRGASIGASTVVDQTGKKVSEKSQSYMRSEFRATAEKNGRRTDIAEGMVDERVVIEGLVDSTQLITLTSEEAVKYGIADTILNSLDEVLESYGLTEADIVSENMDWSENLVRFLNNPVISSLLIMIGLVGLFAEVKTPGWGLPGTAGVIALVLFFGSGYILELASVIEILLFVIGVILLVLEIFVIPGFGIFGILGIIFMVAGLFLGLLSDFKFVDWTIISMAFIQLASAFVMTFILIFILSRVLPKTQIWNRLILADKIISSSGYTTVRPGLKRLVGKTGVALTDLRPSGTAIIEGKRVDVVTAGEFIEKDSPIVIVSEKGSAVVVEMKKDKENA